MKKYLRCLAGLVVLFTAGASSCAPARPNATEFEARLAKVLPAGSSLNRVLVVLDSMAIPHAAYDTESRTVRARLSEPPNRVVSRTIQVTFHFDASRKLVTREVRQRFTGP